MARLAVDVESHLGRNDSSFVLRVRFETEAPTTVVFGASGAGKTSLLRVVAGLLTPDRGLIALDDTVFFDSERGFCLPPYRRQLGMVFQQPSLFPHLTARENVLYSTRMSGESVKELFERFHVAHTMDRKPHRLSGGEQQRVVMARALAARPRLLLLDEPLSAVDASTRAGVLRDLKTYQEEHEVPYLYVTHDRVEALGLGGQALLVDEGALVAQGPAARLLSSPESPAAARVLGTANVLAGRVVGHHEGEGLSQVEIDGVLLDVPYTRLRPSSPVALTIPSEDIILSVDPVGRTSARNTLTGRVLRILEIGTALEILVGTPVTLRAHISRAARDALGLEEGTTVHLLIKAMAIIVDPL